MSLMSQSLTPPEGKVILKVVDEQFQPIAGIDALAAIDSKAYSKKTDSKGAVEYNQIMRVGILGLTVNLDGHYESTQAKTFDKLISNQWQPWPLETTLIVRRIDDPVPMYAVENYRIEMPIVGSAGFDLEKLDWVQPYGKGVYSDFVFTLSRKEDHEKTRATLKLTFSNLGDGVFPLFEYLPGGSLLKMPKEAPLEGYLTNRQWDWVWMKRSSLESRKQQSKFYSELRQQQKDSPPPIGYFFRIRTILDDRGKVKKAMYGKINCWPAVTQSGGRGDLEWLPEHYTKTTYIKLTYYLNPDGTRKMEFDMKNNLFKNLPSEFKPHFP